MREAVTVSKVNAFINNMFEREHTIRDFYMKGEVSNCKYHSSGHIYFTLKDSKSQILCVMFAGQRAGLRFRMEEGQSVIALGSVKVFERDGKYQFYAREIVLDGFGVLYEQYLQLQKRLEAEGLFDKSRKKALPEFATKIGIVTASTGAAIQDICNVANRRNPYVQLYLYPAKVQGEGAAKTVVEGIQYLDKQKMDIIIVTRGGGSIEDLWAFNEEIVARAIFDCNTPVVSAVGHETDTTIADFVADFRAPTPSAAAEVSVFSYLAYVEALKDMEWQLDALMRKNLMGKRAEVERYQLLLKNRSPQNLLLQRKQYIADLQMRLEQSMLKKLENRKHTLSILSEKLHGVSPLQKLQSGYAYVAKEDATRVVSVSQMEKNEKFSLSFQDGTIKAKVIEINEAVEREG